MEKSLKIAKSLLKQKKFHEVIHECNEILIENKESINALKILAKALIEIKKIKEAIIILNRILYLNSEDYEVLKDLGNAYQVSGDIQKARKYYQDSLLINNKYASALTNLGIIETITGNSKKGLKLLIQATINDSKDCNAWKNLSISYIRYKRLEEAEKAILKAIELEPSLYNLHYLLGTILIRQNKIEQAKAPLIKTIKLKPDFADAYSNLGNILKDLGESKESEILLRRAITLKPDCAITHYNLGNTLRDQGLLKEAKIAQEKAISLKPGFTEAYLNLGKTLRDLGRLHEAEKIFKNTISLKTSNLGDQIESSINIAIINLIVGNISQTKIEIEKIERLILQGGIELIKDNNNRSQTKIFFNYLKILSNQLKKSKNKSELNQIKHIGESHCLSFAHQVLTINSQEKSIQPIFIRGAKAWHFANKGKNQWKSSFEEQINNITKSKEIFVSFGEIDCRLDEGILYYSEKNKIDINIVYKNTINSYLDYMEDKLSKISSKRYYFGVPAFTKVKDNLSMNDQRRKDLIVKYNYYLKQEVLKRGSYFLDIFELTSNGGDENNNIYMCDKTHLSPNCLSTLLSKYLYLPKLS